MKCLRCGYCCISLDVVIVDDPEKGPRQSNLSIKETGVPCKHLRGEKCGEISCAVHDKPWYSETPCFQHTQLPECSKAPCRMGSYIMSDKGSEVRQRIEAKLKGAH